MARPVSALEEYLEQLSQFENLLFESAPNNSSLGGLAKYVQRVKSEPYPMNQLVETGRVTSTTSYGDDALEYRNYTYTTETVEWTAPPEPVSSITPRVKRLDRVHWVKVPPIEGDDFPYGGFPTEFAARLYVAGHEGEYLGQGCVLWGPMTKTYSFMPLDPEEGPRVPFVAVNGRVVNKTDAVKLFADWKAQGLIK